MGRRMPIQDPVEIKYIGSVMFHSAFTGPLSGIGYYAEPGQVIQVERIDYKALLEFPSWAVAPRSRKKKGPEPTKRSNE